MAKVKEGDIVKVHYTGKLADGTIFDDSIQREPLQFTVGEHMLIEGFEQAVIGMEPGEWKTVTIPADKAYGPHLKELVIAANLSQMPEGLKPVIGGQLQITQEENKPPVIVTVTDITADKVILDANHPLAGKDLIFDINVNEIVPS
ncbi:MAG: peptidylprolyl isomerase [Candidatus Omnitrophica bacterium]|nr:peptidylprolyl isomerase [Candidatus Omnitrophota bacterium]